MTQLALPVNLDDYAVFASFLPAGNEPVVAFLKHLCEQERLPPAVWIWGEPATGKSHLLQAVCAGAEGRAAYLPLGDVLSLGPGILSGLEAFRLLCVDDVELLAGGREWESALLLTYESLLEARGCLLVSAATAPAGVSFQLADLASRLGSGPVFRLAGLDDAGLTAALHLRARRRGLALSAEAARFLVRRVPRDPAWLFGFLDRLDGAALQAQRRLTLPFVRDFLAREQAW